MPDSETVTIAGAWQKAKARLPDEDPASLSELFDRGLGITPAVLHAFPERRLSAMQCERLEQLLQRRATGEPLAYVLGRRGFWSLDLEVDPNTLIPRVDTERLVEVALQLIPPDADWQVADLGSGSGAIALALAKERPACRLLGIDKSAAALRVARRNAETHGLRRVCWLTGDWLSALQADSVDMLVSNPPYIAAADPHLQQGDLRFEPASALASGIDGLDDIRQLVQAAPRCLRGGGWLLFEHGWDQGAAVRALLAARGFESVRTEPDYEQRDRVSLGRWSQALRNR
ncbi:peptide chain release factor N(5)-glutamine methyltransferase [Pseudomarimonas arenosa]|uniref:Release factor glutamine methyltransferase n=1 Tax=Pseudomarimonas arenosa TaxID=2774145 RepID=A0AAW3ZPS7_9GAMM|nr:peptide chain release factor N(5)-glutamine methyltransferase [Pseudomarimonas arenosa]MBD8528121.1 peptide chain release factor N(5)-glutamine methyltransferase [Pseudomarimonas arenosa]